MCPPCPLSRASREPIDYIRACITYAILLALGVRFSRRKMCDSHTSRASCVADRAGGDATKAHLIVTWSPKRWRARRGLQATCSMPPFVVQTQDGHSFSSVVNFPVVRAHSCTAVMLRKYVSSIIFFVFHISDRKRRAHAHTSVERGNSRTTKCLNCTDPPALVTICRIASPWCTVLTKHNRRRWILLYSCFIVLYLYLPRQQPGAFEQAGTKSSTACRSAASGRWAARAAH